MNKKSVIVVLLIIAVIASVATIALNASEDEYENVQLNEGQNSASLNLVVDLPEATNGSVNENE